MKHGLHRSQGFSLVELMVALLIGLVIILGAGQLFLTSFHNFSRVEELSDKQAALMFAADVLIKDIRRATSIKGTDVGEVGKFEITLTDGSIRKYFLKKSEYEDQNTWSLYLEENGSAEPVVEGFTSDGFSAVEDELLLPGLYVIGFGLIAEENDVVFHAMNRTAAVTKN